jgi:transposase-like protein
MPRRYTVCDHPERHSIDEALVSGAPYRSVAKRFGLSESAVYRHKTEHLPAHLLRTKEAEEAALYRRRSFETYPSLKRWHDNGRRA